MAWEWSHTAEAYCYARRRVLNLPKKELLTILREWNYYDLENAGKRPHFRLPHDLTKMPKDMLADQVWDRMSELRLCDNGGHRAWCCPDGCHGVTFDFIFDKANGGGR